MRMPVAAVLILLALSVGARAEEAIAVDLELRPGNPGYSYGCYTLSEKPPEGVQPLECDETVWYSKSRLGNRDLLAAVQFDAEPTWLRVDLNFDGDLRDETPIREIQRGRRYFTRQLVPVGPEGEQLDVPVDFYYQRTEEGSFLWINVAARWIGEIVLEGRLRQIAAYDRDGDLRFDTPEKDGFSLDLNGDRVLHAKEAITSAEPFRLGEHGYELTVADGTGRLILRRTEEVPPHRWTPWHRSQIPAAGQKPRRTESDLAALIALYEAAAKQDRAKGPTWSAFRLKVVPRIGAVGTPEAFAELHRLFKAEARHFSLRESIVRAMGWATYVGEADSVMEIARTALHPRLRVAAIRALHYMDAPGREDFLLDRLKSERHLEAFQALATNLAYLQTPAAVEALAKATGPKEEMARRTAAYSALVGFSTGPPPPDVIREALETGDGILKTWALRDAFISHLPQAREIGLAEFRAADETSPTLGTCLEHLGTASDPEAVEALFQLAVAMPAVRARIVPLLQPVRVEKSIRFLADKLARGTPEERVVAVSVLAGMGGPIVAGTLFELVPKQRDEGVLTEVVRVLATHPTAEATAAVLAAVDPRRCTPELLAVAADYLLAAAIGADEVRPFIEGALKRREWQKRVIALDLLAALGAPADATILLKATKDRTWQVRLTAVEGLRRIRVKEAVVPLIDLLEREKLPRIREAISESLWRITGRNYYDIVELWRRWWEEDGEAFEVPERLPERIEDGHGAQSVASFYGMPVRSERVIFVLDQSGSMSSAAGEMTRLARAVTETLKVVKELPRRARFNVILFETNVHPWRSKLVPVGPESRGSLKRHLKATLPTGGTNIFDALELALLTEEVDTIYLLSDGVPGTGKWTRTPDILREVKKLNRIRRIEIHCVSVGTESDLLRRLAAQNGGRYVRS